MAPLCLHVPPHLHSACSFLPHAPHAARMCPHHHTTTASPHVSIQLPKASRKGVCMSPHSNHQNIPSRHGEDVHANPAIYPLTTPTHTYTLHDRGYRPLLQRGVSLYHHPHHPLHAHSTCEQGQLLDVLLSHVCGFWR